MSMKTSTFCLTKLLFLFDNLCFLHCKKNGIALFAGSELTGYIPYWSTQKSSSHFGQVPTDAMMLHGYKNVRKHQIMSFQNVLLTVFTK